MFRFECSSDDLDLLTDLLTAVAGGAVDLAHTDPAAPSTTAVLIESVANGAAVMRHVNEDGEPVSDDFPVDIGSITHVTAW